MCSAQVSATHSTTGLNVPAWHVVAVSSLPQWRLRLRFADGAAGEADLSGLIARDDAGVFAALRDAALFNQVSIIHGAPSWPGDVDLAPDALHAAIQADGHCVL